MAVYMLAQQRKKNTEDRKAVSRFDVDFIWLRNNIQNFS